MFRVAATLVALLTCACSNSSAPSAVPPASGEHRPLPAVAAPAAAATAPVGKPGMVEGGVRPHHEEVVVECPAKIADSADDDARVGMLLDEANKQ
ncbi:MAG TPA: hypothetical protein VGG28_25990, partial [Kofleriaceae bacterium]